MVNQIPDIKQSCLRCGKKELITDTETGEIFCGGCGYVSSERVESTGPERRSFPDDRMNRERTGGGTSLAIHDQGLSTVIGPTNRDSTGKPLSSSMKQTL
ncbi:MAG: transcription initiation factor IIB, partial [Thaumarchaeota archaeon]|nr:transcription initiation factor IIB [Nitrososphaerota archaeon]